MCIMYDYYSNLLKSQRF
ncbi:hypothetical protein E2320_011526, partial [Naja naja]